MNFDRWRCRQHRLDIGSGELESLDLPVSGQHRLDRASRHTERDQSW
ncbi:MAG: hypothetical protein IT349_21055 [Candidatus Eisenbacteria bacterium]|nr:hypothetical protein [Candidatus Eisenbacteria bacterium]MCC7144596.1 hypothetical protein [Candidatus Eisenbacteria bacterium]